MMNINLKNLITQSNFVFDQAEQENFDKFINNFVNECICVMTEKDYHGEWLGEQIKLHFGLDKITLPAKNLEGFLIKIAGTDKMMFRVYNHDHSFQDYDIAHLDLEIKILSDDACIRQSGNSAVIDYSSDVLGT